MLKHVKFANKTEKYLRKIHELFSLLFAFDGSFSHSGRDWGPSRYVYREFNYILLCVWRKHWIRTVCQH